MRQEIVSKSQVGISSSRRAWQEVKKLCEQGISRFPRLPDVYSRDSMYQHVASCPKAMSSLYARSSLHPLQFFVFFFRIRAIYNRAAKLLSKTAPPRLKAETATAYTSCAR
jgi:hypothetical protein